MSWWAPWLRSLWSEQESVTGHADPIGRPEDLDIDAEGWLIGHGVRLVPSKRSMALSTVQGPLGIVWHFTATDHGTAHSLAQRIRSYRRGIDRAASWHVCIAHDGMLWQSVPFMRGSWHCAKGNISGHRINACTVGVELEGHGKEFPRAQVDAAVRLLSVLMETYPIDGPRAQLKHSQYDPARRSDPGPVWSEMLPGLVVRASVASAQPRSEHGE